MANFNIKNIDCLIGLIGIQSETIDCLITDPPFNISQDKKELQRKTMNSPMFAKRTSISLDYGEWDKRSEIDFYNFTEQWFKEVVRTLKEKAWIYIFFSKERIGYFTDPMNGLFQKYGIKTRTIISWIKSNPTPSFRKMNYLSGSEFIVVGSKGKSKIPNFLKQSQMKNWYETPNSSIYGETEHPNEKPLNLINWLIATGSNENDTILDCFVGSGSIGKACIQSNRNFVGFETDKKYFEISQKRINAEKSQTKLFQIKNVI